MNATTFDSLSALRRLKEAGLEQGPAEAIAETMREATAANREDLATKADLATLEARIKAEFKALKAEFKAELSAMANRIITINLVALGVLLAALKLL